MAFETRIRLIIWNESLGILDFAQVERALGIGAPDSTWRKGDRFGYRSQRTRNADGMAYNVFEGRDRGAIEEAALLLQRLEDAGDAASLVFKQHQRTTNPLAAEDWRRNGSSSPDFP